MEGSSTGQVRHGSATGPAPVSFRSFERNTRHQGDRIWQTQTFIATLRHDRLDAPWVIDGPINRELFDLYVATQFAPTRQKDDVIILDNLSVHKSPRAAQILTDTGGWFLPLPPYSPASTPSKWPSPN
jgi:DDE superfamily endonuclease